MGIRLTVYYGPLILVENKEVKIKNKMRTCPTNQCKNHLVGMSSQFCEKCGTKIDLVEYEKEGPEFDLNKFCWDGISEALFIPPYCDDVKNKTILLPNNARNRLRNYMVDTNESVNLIETADREKEIAQLSNDFSVEIQKLKEFCKDETKVSVSWGLLTFYW